MRRGDADGNARAFSTVGFVFRSSIAVSHHVDIQQVSQRNVPVHCSVVGYSRRPRSSRSKALKMPSFPMSKRHCPVIQAYYFLLTPTGIVLERLTTSNDRDIGGNLSRTIDSNACNGKYSMVLLFLRLQEDLRRPKAPALRWIFMVSHSHSRMWSDQESLLQSLGTIAS
jgi:hypothetical protein